MHSFSAEETRLNSVETNPLQFCEFTALDDVVAIGIQCPTIFLGAMEVQAELRCEIEFWLNWAPIQGSKIVTRAVKPNQLTELRVNPPHGLPTGTGDEF